MFNVLLVIFLTEKPEWYGEWCICEKTTVFNRQLINMHKHTMCCRRRVVGFKLPEDGFNKQQNA